MAALAAVTPDPPPSPVEPVLQRWLTPLVELARGFAGGPPHEVLTKLIEASVRVQVHNVAKSEPVRKAWAEGKNVRVHGLIYELETGRLRDLNVTKEAQA